MKELPDQQLNLSEICGLADMTGVLGAIQQAGDDMTKLKEVYDVWELRLNDHFYPFSPIVRSLKWVLQKVYMR